MAEGGKKTGRFSLLVVLPVAFATSAPKCKNACPRNRVDPYRMKRRPVPMAECNAFFTLTTPTGMVDFSRRKLSLH